MQRGACSPRPSPLGLRQDHEIATTTEANKSSQCSYARGLSARIPLRFPQIKSALSSSSLLLIVHLALKSSRRPARERTPCPRLAQEPQGAENTPGEQGSPLTTGLNNSCSDSAVVPQPHAYRAGKLAAGNSGSMPGRTAPGPEPAHTGTQLKLACGQPCMNRRAH